MKIMFTQNQLDYRNNYEALALALVVGNSSKETEAERQLRSSPYARWANMFPAERMDLMAPGVLDRDDGPVNKDFNWPGEGERRFIDEQRERIRVGASRGIRSAAKPDYRSRGEMKERRGRHRKKKQEGER